MLNTRLKCPGALRQESLRITSSNTGTLHEQFIPVHCPASEWNTVSEILNICLVTRGRKWNATHWKLWYTAVSIGNIPQISGLCNNDLLDKMLTSCWRIKKSQYNASNRIVSFLAYQFQSSFRQCKSKFNQTAVQYPKKHQSVLLLVSSCPCLSTQWN